MVAKLALWFKPECDFETISKYIQLRAPLSIGPYRESLKMTSLLPFSSLAALLGLCICLWAEQDGKHSSEQSPDPQAYFKRVMANPNLKVEAKVTGEQFCWHAASAADDFVDAYLAWNDPAWLDQGAAYFDWLESLLTTGPDGYRGWIGPYIYDKRYWCDVHVGDAILFNPMLRFAETVLADTALTKTHGVRARRYVALARRELMEKWDQRGTWHEDGPTGSYRAWDRSLVPGDLSEWRDHNDHRAGLSLPFNKQMDMGLAALRLYRLSGEERYRQRAQSVFALFKARLRLLEGGYVWNYWEPLGSWDIDRDAGRIRHWVNVHPSRNYQAREVAFVVEAYHTGVVFEPEDIERLIHTNLGHMWNGDFDAPRWRNAGVGGPWREPQTKGAGTLWSALADFDGRARRLQAGRLQPGGIDRAYFDRVVAARPPGLARRFTETAEVAPALVATQAPRLVMAAVLPQVLRADTEALIICKASAADSLHVGLHAADGVLLDTLYSGDIAGGEDGLAGIFWFSLDGASLAPGRYTVRWALGNEYRQYAFERR
jgi:hypothetical protein